MPLSSGTGRASSNENASGQASPHLHDQRRSASQENKRTRREGASRASPVLDSSLTTPTRPFPTFDARNLPRKLFPSRVSFTLAPSVRPQSYRPPTTGFVRNTHSPTLRLRGAARMQIRGVVEHLRTAQLVIARALNAEVCAEVLALKAEVLAGQTALASADEMRRAVVHERDIRKRVGALRSELAGAVGSRKSWTMEGGIRRRRRGLFRARWRRSSELKDNGHTYTMERQVLEIVRPLSTLLSCHPPTPSLTCTSPAVQEPTTDAPGPTEPPCKHEMLHPRQRSAVAGARTLAQVLAQAQGRRRIAVPLMNKRSSRAHSVFTLRIRGTHACGACARGRAEPHGRGWKRVPARGVGVGRVKETQRFNRSLPAPGDVVVGNSKTLIVLNLSPLVGHPTSPRLDMKIYVPTAHLFAGE
ncbi:hypothetical protein FB451DRAFT_1393742 [Mycena latifolia]|nr:hypothetical protein FB451DRAFT_1393742 [Mycena latifolia]